MLFKVKYLLVDAMLWAWSMAGLNAEILGEPATKDILVVRPIGGLSGIMPETIQWAILRLALEKSGRDFDLAPSRASRLYGREGDEMRRLGEEGNIIWASPIHPQREEMLPIEIPISRGLSSYQYLWVRPADLKLFSHVRTADDVKDFPILTGQNWGANDILEADGFELRKGYSANLPGMLMAGRGDILLWPVFGIFNIYEKYGVANLEMTPIQDVLVHLPQAVYFWVAQDGSEDLHDAVESVLRAAMKDGYLNELMRSFPRIGEVYSDLLSKEFVVIRIDNPNMSDHLQRELTIYGVKVNEGGKVSRA